jgi:hypothetical protein
MASCPPQQRWQVISNLLDFAGTQPPQTSKKNDNQVMIKFLSEQEWNKWPFLLMNHSFWLPVYARLITTN